MSADPKIFARRMRQRRTDLRWGEKKLAGVMGISDSTVQYYESGDLKKLEKVSRQVAEALMVSEDWLLGKADGRPPPPPELTPGQFADHYAGLSAPERQEWTRRALSSRKNE